LGDGGLAKKAHVFANGVDIDNSGNIYITDFIGSRVRKINAIANLNAFATSVTFPSQKVGTSSTKSFTLHAIGPLDISGISITGSTAFTQTNNCPSAPASGSSCTVTITFKPTAKGTVHATFTAKTNGFFVPNVTVTLTGSGS